MSRKGWPAATTARAPASRGADGARKNTESPWAKGSNRALAFVPARHIPDRRPVARRRRGLSFLVGVSAGLIVAACALSIGLTPGRHAWDETPTIEAILSCEIGADGRATGRRYLHGRCED